MGLDLSIQSKKKVYLDCPGRMYTNYYGDRVFKSNLQLVNPSTHTKQEPAIMIFPSNEYWSNSISHNYASISRSLRGFSEESGAFSVYTLLWTPPNNLSLEYCSNLSQMYGKLLDLKNGIIEPTEEEYYLLTLYFEDFIHVLEFLESFVTAVSRIVSKCGDNEELLKEYELFAST